MTNTPIFDRLRTETISNLHRGTYDHSEYNFGGQVFEDWLNHAEFRDKLLTYDQARAMLGYPPGGMVDHTSTVTLEPGERLIPPNILASQGKSLLEALQASQGDDHLTYVYLPKDYTIDQETALENAQEWSRRTGALNRPSQPKNYVAQDGDIVLRFL